MDNPYGVEPDAQPGVHIPLGATRRYILLSLATICLIVGLTSTFLFQRVSKRDNNLRQRGRYLVTLQGYIGTVFVSIVLYYQAYKYRFPCAPLFWATNWGIIPFVLIFLARGWRLITRFDRNIAIHQSRFAEPSDLAALELDSKTLSENNEGSILVTTLRPTRRSSVTIVSDSTAIGLSDLQPSGHGMNKEKAFELTQRTPQETAEMKKWYNRYRHVTDTQMLYASICYVLLDMAVMLYFQFEDKTLSLNPVHYDCHSGNKFIMIYFTTIVFMLVLAPFLIFQLRHTNDGFGIRNELIFISCLAAPCSILYFVVPKFAPEFSRVIFDKSNYLVIINIVSHITSTIIPLLRHYRSTSVKRPSTPERLERKATSQKIFKNKRSQNDSIIMAPGLVGNNDITGDVGGVGYQGWSNIDNTRMNSDQQGIFIGDQTSSSSEGMAKLEGEGTFQPQIPDRTNSIGNIQISIKSVIKNQQRNGRPIFGRSISQGRIINEKKADWDEFIRVLENKEMFRKMSAFTVREFCAENTRFLYEVSRLERRAVQYEHLREMASETDNSLHQQHQQNYELQSPTSTVCNDEFDIGSPGSRISIIAPLPTHFSSATRGTGFNETPHRIKKIVSASSMSSTAPMLSQRAYTNSQDNYSEPPSPISSHSSVFRNRRNSSVALDLEGFSDVSLPPMPTNNNSSSSSNNDNSTTSNNNNNNNNAGGKEELSSTELRLLSNSLKTFAPLPMPPTLLIQFEYIYKTFIETGARLELNLSHNTLQDLHRIAKTGAWASGVFDSAIFEVQELLFRNVWPKFVTSSQGLNLYAAAAAASSNPSSCATSEHGFTRSSGIGKRQFDHPVIRTASHVASYPSSEQPISPSRSGSGKSTSPKSSMSRATASDHVSLDVICASENATGPSRTRRKDSIAEVDEEGEEEEGDMHSNSGFKTWLKSRSRKGIATVTMNSRQGDYEESVGIVEQSRRSMLERRSDTSGLYSTSIQNALAPQK